MTLDPEDKEYFKLLVESSVNGAMKPVYQHLAEIDLAQQEQRQTLTGIDGTNGVVGKVKKLEEFRESVNVRIAAVAGGFSVVGALGIKLITSILGGK